MASEKEVKPIDSAPDPDEDDLDDLDDVLDEFQAKPAPSTTTPATTTSTAPSASKPEPSRADDNDPSGATEEEFAKQLQSGMAELIAELDSDPDMQKQFEAMMKELMAAGAAPTDQEAGAHIREAAKAAPKASSQEGSNDKSGKPSSSKPDPFGDTIRKTMERMQQSGDAATAAASTSNANLSEDDLLAQMMRELSSGGEGGEEDFNKMLMNMMTQLTNKEILYDPMKELHDRFPAWLEANAEKTSQADLSRYREQQTLVRDIVTRFERKQYSDDNEDDREYIVDRMQKMQAAGSPPPDLVGDMSAAQEMLGDLDGGCPTQ